MNSHNHTKALLINISGTLYEGADKSPATSEFSLYSDGTVIFDTNCSKKKRHIESLKILDKESSIELPEGSIFRTQDISGLVKIAESFKKNRTHQFMTWMENSKKVFLPILILIVLGVVGTIKWGIPYMAKVIAYQLPYSILDETDQITLKALDSQYTTASSINHSLKEQTFNTFNETVDTFRKGGFKFKLLLRKGGAIGANAFALPGGTIIVTDELIRMVKQPEQLKGILAHEIGHIVMRHSSRTVIQNSIAIIAISSIFGDLSSASSIMAGIPILLINGKYSRDFEREADQFSKRYMIQQGIDPIHLVNILEQMGRKPGNSETPTILSTHPSVEERRKLLLKDTIK